jgi:hypothetical protein
MVQFALSKNFVPDDWQVCKHPAAVLLIRCCRESFRLRLDVDIESFGIELATIPNQPRY